PFRVGTGELVQVGVSMGVAVCRDPAARAVDVVRDADLALLRAKRQGRNRFELAEVRPHDELDQRARTARDIAEALDERRFRLHYQPIVETATGQIVGAEALVRMVDRDGELVPPDQFIPVAEDTGLIVPLGRWVLQTACRTACGWDPTQHLGVNVSSHQLDDQLVADVVASLSSSGLDAERLWIEVTETALAGDATGAIR